MKQIIKERIEQIKRGEIPDGYKLTDIGIVPIEWEAKQLKTLGSFSKGKGLPGTEMKNDGIPCIGYGDIYTKYNYKFEQTQNFVDQEIADESVPIQKGTLLFTCSGETAMEIGKCVCYMGDETIYAGGDIAIFKPNNKVDSLFISYQQSIFPTIKRKARLGQGHSVVHIYSDSLGKLTVVYPKSVDEQQKIGNILSEWGKAVLLEEQLIEKLQLHRKALMQKLLCPRAGWKKVTVGSLTKEVSVRNKDNDCFNIKSVSNKSGFINQDEQFSKQVASQDLTNYKKVNLGDIAYNPSRINVGSIALYDEVETGIVSPMYVVFRCKKISPKLLLLFLSTNRGKYDIQSYLTGSVRDSLNYSDLENIVISIPDDKTQDKLVAFFDYLDEMIEVHKKKLLSMKQQQKSLQQLLLTGIVRVD